MPGIYTPLEEWCNTNAHRQFPMDDSVSGIDTTGAYQLPTTFLVDMLLAVPPSTDVAKYYIRSITARRYSVDVEIGYDDGTALAVANVVNIPTTAARNSVYYIAPALQSNPINKPFEMLCGALVVGSCADVAARPGYWAFAPSSTYILAARVLTGLICVQSLRIGTQILTGDIVLKAGKNMRIQPTYDPVADVTRIVFSMDTLSGEPDIVLASNADIITALTSLYGAPIVSINSAPPGPDGNFAIDGEDCVDVTTLDGAIVLTNPCAEPCCDNSYLDGIYKSIAELNLRYAGLEAYYQSLSRNVNEMQARLIGLEL